MDAHSALMLGGPAHSFAVVCKLWLWKILSCLPVYLLRFHCACVTFGMAVYFQVTKYFPNSSATLPWTVTNDLDIFELEVLAGTASSRPQRPSVAHDGARVPS